MTRIDDIQKAVKSALENMDGETAETVMDGYRIEIYRDCHAAPPWETWACNTPGIIVFPDNAVCVTRADPDVESPVSAALNWIGSASATVSRMLDDRTREAVFSIDGFDRADFADWKERNGRDMPGDPEAIRFGDWLQETLEGMRPPEHTGSRMSNDWERYLTALAAVHAALGTPASLRQFTEMHAGDAILVFGVVTAGHREATGNAFDTPESLEREFAGNVENIKTWADGGVLGYCVEMEADGEHVDSCGGIYDSEGDYFVSEVVGAIAADMRARAWAAPHPFSLESFDFRDMAVAS